MQFYAASETRFLSTLNEPEVELCGQSSRENALRRAYARLFFMRGTAEGGFRFVSGFIPQMAAADLCGRDRTAACHRHAARSASERQTQPCVSVHRYARHGQDDLRENSRPGGQLRASGERRPVQRMRRVPRHSGRLGARRDRNRRGVQQRRGQHPRPARRNALHPGAGQKARVHHRRGAYAVHRRVQRAAQNARRAARARAVHPRDDRAAQGPGDHPFALSALRLPPHRRGGHRAAAA